MSTLIRCHVLWYLICIYTVPSDLTVPILRVILVSIYQGQPFAKYRKCPKMSNTLFHTCSKCINFAKINSYFLTHLCLASHKWDIGKQCRPRSDAAECGIWSGPALFAVSTGISIKHGYIKKNLTPLLLEMYLNALYKVLSNWVFWANFTHPISYWIEYHDFSFGYPVILMGAKITVNWVFTP